MAWQLLYTSAPRTLNAGQSGYGTVARTIDLRDALAQRLEQLSYYTVRQGQVVHASRILTVRGATYFVLTRIQDAGLDFTNRTNHLAHHLIFTADELAALPSPPLIFLHWNAWTEQWRDEPRYLNERDWGNLREIPRAIPLPARRWAQAARDAGRAAGLLQRAGGEGTAFFTETTGDSTLLELLAEALQLLDPSGASPSKRWEIPFTTRLQPQDSTADFRWRCGAPQGAITLAELSIPENELARIAREGRAAPEPVRLRIAATKPTAAPELETRVIPRKAVLSPPEPPAPATLASARRANRRAWPAIAAVCVVIALLALLPRLRAPVPSRPEKAAERAEPTPKSAKSLVEPEPAAPGTPKPQKWDISPSVRQELRARFDETSTYVVRGVAGAPAVLPNIPGLELLMKRAFADAAPIGAGSVQALANQADFSLQPGKTRLSLEFDPLTKSISGRDANKKWFEIAPGETQPAYTISLPPGEFLSFSVVLSHAQDAFTPFRLLVAGPENVKPFALGKALLREGGQSVEGSLHPDLLKLLEVFDLSTDQKWQLRPSCAQSPRDLYDDLAFAPGTLPGGLNFASLRFQFETNYSVLATNAAELSRQFDQLAGSPEIVRPPDFPLGQLITPWDTHLVSFGAYLQQRPATRETFKEYLLTVVRAFVSEAQMAKGKGTIPPSVQFPERLDETHAWVEAYVGKEIMRRIPAHYFGAHWRYFEAVKEQAALRVKKEQLESSLRASQGKLSSIPRSLAECRQVDLRLVDRIGKVMTFIRFTDEEGNHP